MDFKRILTIQDISCVGQCSLTVALPIISACGIETSVLPSAVRARVAVEAGATMCWYKYVGMDGKVVGIDTFGESAPAGKLFVKYGFTVENVVNAALDVVK